MAKTNYKGEFLTTEQLADRWGMKVETLEIWRQRGKGPKWIRLSEGKRPSIRYPLELIHQYEALNTMPSTGKSETSNATGIF